MQHLIRMGKYRNQFNLILTGLTKRCSELQLNPRREYESYAYGYLDPDMSIRGLIGNREIVTWGVNGQPGYVDRSDFPFPAIRYMPPLPEIQAVREKERGNWHKLTIQEKKLLYRSQYCQTFAEFQYPTDEWKYIVGCGLILISSALWLFIIEKHFVFAQKPLPSSFYADAKREQLKRMINMRNNPITGLASMWDYENKKWKKKPWWVPWDDPFDDYQDLCKAN